LRSAKRGEAQRPFTSAVLPLGIAQWVAKELVTQTPATPEDVRTIFAEARRREQFLGQTLIPSPEPSPEPSSEPSPEPSSEPSPEPSPAALYSALLAEMRATRATVLSALLD
jgi:hypothetical protein